MTDPIERVLEAARKLAYASELSNWTHRSTSVLLSRIEILRDALEAMPKKLSVEERVAAAMANKAITQMVGWPAGKTYEDGFADACRSLAEKYDAEVVRLTALKSEKDS